MNWYLEALKKYAQFTGRSRRKEYWFFLLFSVLVSIALSIVDGLVGLSGLGVGAFSSVYGLGVFIPSIAVAVRRLHDCNRSGWWLLLSFIPFLGAIVLIIFLLQDSTPGENQYGANPKESI